MNPTVTTPMTGVTTNATIVLTRTQKVELFRQFHEPMLRQVAGPGAFFGCKSITERSVGGYNLPIGKVGFFESELFKGDYYFELTTYKLESIDPNRQLYKLKHNPNFMNEPEIYQLVEITPANNPQYYVDPKFFEKVHIPSINDDLQFDDDDDKSEASFEKFSQRDYACIHLGVPDSKKQWLNNLIKKSKQLQLN